MNAHCLHQQTTKRASFVRTHLKLEARVMVEPGAGEASFVFRQEAVNVEGGADTARPLAGRRRDGSSSGALLTTLENSLLKGIEQLGHDST